MSAYTLIQLVMVAVHGWVYFQFGFDPCLFFAGLHASLFLIPGLSGDISKAKQAEETAS
jgi:hypothetical protein